MNVDETLQQTKSQFPMHTVDKEKFIDSFWARIHEVENEPRRKSRRKYVVSTAAAVVVGGIACAPVIASAVQKVPFTEVVLSWVKGTDVAPYVRNVQRSSTDHGITMTITDILYGPSELTFGYTVSPGQSGFPHGGVVGLGSPNGMQFFVNGKSVHLQGMSSDEATAYGFKGLVTLTDSGTETTLPKTFNFEIVLHKIGNQRGTWKFTVPVSRTSMKPAQAFLPMVTKQVGNETITVKEIQLYPTGGMIDYDVTVPHGVAPSLYMNLYNQNKNILDLVTADATTAQSHTTNAGSDTWSYSQSFRVPDQKPTTLIISASIPSKTPPRLLPLTGPFPVTLTSEVFGTMTITGADVKGNTVIVHYSESESNSDGNPRPGFGFSIRDMTHPNESWGGTPGKRVGSSKAAEFENVYQFSNNVSSDKLMLQLPPQTKDYVFDVPLQSNSN